MPQSLELGRLLDWNHSHLVTDDFGGWVCLSSLICEKKANTVHVRVVIWIYSS